MVVYKLQRVRTLLRLSQFQLLSFVERKWQFELMCADIPNYSVTKICSVLDENLRFEQSTMFRLLGKSFGNRSWQSRFNNRDNLFVPNVQVHVLFSVTMKEKFSLKKSWILLSPTQPPMALGIRRLNHSSKHLKSLSNVYDKKLLQLRNAKLKHADKHIRIYCSAKIMELPEQWSITQCRTEWGSRWVLLCCCRTCLEQFLNMQSSGFEALSRQDTMRFTRFSVLLARKRTQTQLNSPKKIL
jgi:hypothetical protein